MDPARRKRPAGPPPETSLGDAQDGELVSRMAAGDQEAARELFHRLSSIAYSLARRITGRPEDAEEVLVDTFHQAWASAGQYDPGRATVAGWILNIARSRAIDHRRARERWRQRGQAARLDVATFPPAAPDTPETEAARGEQRALLRRVIATLSPDQRRAVELAYFGGLSQSRIARELRLPLGTVKTRLRLAMEKIRKALSGVDDVSP